jgi:hypothetical protein
MTGNMSWSYEEQTGFGEALADGVAYIVNLPNRRSFSPDASYTFDIPDEEREMKFISRASVTRMDRFGRSDVYPPYVTLAYALACRSGSCYPTPHEARGG